MRRTHGFSLIELMIATAVVGLVTFYMLGGIISSNRAYTVVDQVAESQQGMRAIAELMERDLRHAGMMVPPEGALCAVDRTGAPDTLYVSDAAAIDPDDDFHSYTGALIPTSTTNVSVPNDTLTLGSLVIEPSPPSRPAYDLDGDGTNESDFRVGSGVIVVDTNNPGRGTACGRVMSINAGTPSITVRFATQALAAGAGVQLVAIPAHEYTIENGDQLLRNNRLLSDGVEDLQLALFFDANDNGVVDGNEVEGVSGNDYVAQSTDITALREVRLNLVVRTRLEDPTFEGQAQQWENRTGAAANDGFRRRSYQSTVRLRNMVDRVEA